MVGEGREAFCLSVGGARIDEAVTRAFLEVLEPVRLSATLAAAERIESDREAALKQWRHDVERAEFAASRTERRYRAVDPDNRLVARSLEREWERSLKALEAARIKLAQRERDRPRILTTEERGRLLAVGVDLTAAWQARTTTSRDRKELLRTLIDDITFTVDRDRKEARLALRWKGGEISQIELGLPRTRAAPVKTDEETVALVRRLAEQHSDAVIASILNKQGRKTARGHRFDANRIKGLRQRQEIPGCSRKPGAAPAGETVSLPQAAAALGVAPTTLLRHLQDGLIEGEQVTAGAPWRVRLNNELRARFTKQPSDGYMSMHAVMAKLRVSRQSVLQKIKRNELQAVFVTGRRNGIYVKVASAEPNLFEQAGCNRGAI
jgi:hypothetical protein